jgi:lysophospholipase L1-like esterase
VLALAPLLVLVAGEALLARLWPPPPHAFLWPPGMKRTFRPDPVHLPGVQGPSRFHVNSLGWRGFEPPAEDVRSVVYALAVGGSTTECLYLDQARAWPAIVERILGQRGQPLWLANAGRSGHTTREHRLQVDEYLRGPLRPQVILLLAGVNDLCRRLAQDAEYDPSAMARADYVRALESEAFALLPSGRGPRRPWWKETGSFRAARSLLWRVRGDGRAQDETGAIYQRWRARRQARTRTLTQLPPLEEAMAEYRANLEAIAQACSAAGVRLVLLTQPHLWRADLEPDLEQRCWMGGVGNYTQQAGSPYYSAAALAEGQQRYNESLRALAPQLGLELIDLEAGLPKDGSHFYDDVHMTDLGSARAAEIVAEHMARHTLPALARPASSAAPGKAQR